MSHCVRIWNITPENYEIRFNLPPNCGFPGWILHVRAMQNCASTLTSLRAQQSTPHTCLCTSEMCRTPAVYPYFVNFHTDDSTITGHWYAVFSATLPLTYFLYMPIMANQCITGTILTYCTFFPWALSWFAYSLRVACVKRLRLHSPTPGIHFQQWQLWMLSIIIIMAISHFIIIMFVDLAALG